MSALVNFLYLYIDFSLVAIFVTISALVLGIGIKMKSKFFKRMVFVFLIIFLVVNHLQFTTFEKFAAKKINEETDIKEVTITIRDTSGDFPERKASVTLKDEETIYQILSDFEAMKLKRLVIGERRTSFQEFEISFLTTNLMDLNYYLTDSFTLYVDDEYLNNYRILGETNHLRTIEELIENEEIGWE
ncbi:hypothetical protein H1D32_08675 [Anaerobacillus sp. CMMVII]|uniref:hypothetical protein n=1 Tax=Anaerobacillus sp. CMMVII TaxID=2755588 RepID=UPI0021B819F4|nr:hypothetical protein [Anaerobacillus sp. CMMVII]MCT8137823.1 hypothetical protein [Anaerobacillus sp. CMMVII]